MQLSRQVMTYLRMPLSIETGKEAEFNTSTDTEHKRRLIFLQERAAIMRERPCFPMAGVQSLDNLRMTKKWGIKIKDSEVIWERFALQLNPVGNFLLILQMTLRSTHTKIYLSINDPSIHLSIQYLFPSHSLAKRKKSLIYFKFLSQRKCFDREFILSPLFLYLMSPIELFS